MSDTKSLYTEETLTVLHEQLRDKFFCLAQQTSDDESVIAEQITYHQTIGLLREGIPEIIIIGEYPLEQVDAIIRDVLAMITTPDPKDRTWEAKLMMHGKGGATAYAKTCMLSPEQKERYGRVYGALFPEKSFEMIQVMLPDTNGVLPDHVQYVNYPASNQYYLGVNDDGRELFAPAPPTPEGDPVMLPVEKLKDEVAGKPAVVDSEYMGVKLYHTIGMTALGHPEIVISGNYDKETVDNVIFYMIDIWTLRGRDEKFMDFRLEMDMVDDTDPDNIREFIAYTKTVAVLPQFRTAVDGVLKHLVPNGNYELVQIVLPDDAGKLPGDEGYNNQPEGQVFLGEVEMEGEPIVARLLDSEDQS
jgi:Domain of unknown function (DUF4262)